MASRRYVTLQNQVRQDVLTARARLLQALVNLQVVERKLIPATKNVSDLAQKNFEGGGRFLYFGSSNRGTKLARPNPASGTWCGRPPGTCGIGTQRRPSNSLSAGCRRTPRCPIFLPRQSLLLGTCPRAVPYRIRRAILVKSRVSIRERAFVRGSNADSLTKVDPMNPRLLVLLILLFALWGCGKSKTPTANPAPAKVEAHPNEADIYRLILTEKAESRLGIKTVPVTMKALPRHRTVGGLLRLPDGASLVVTAPVSGTIRKNQSERNAGSRNQIGGGRDGVGSRSAAFARTLRPHARRARADGERPSHFGHRSGHGRRRCETGGSRGPSGPNRFESALSDCSRTGRVRPATWTMPRRDWRLPRNPSRPPRNASKALKDIRLDVAPSPEYGS